jgi:adenylate kinase
LAHKLTAQPLLGWLRKNSLKVMIILIGMAGTGKSTQGQILAKHLNCPWISVGNVLRAHVSGEYAKKMLAGELISDSELFPLLAAEFKKIHAEREEFILDGSPRTMEQARWLCQKVKDGDLKMTAAVHLNAEQEVAKARLLARGRPDDYEGAINERFAEYEKVIIPILSYLQNQGFIIHEIDAEQPQEKVAADIERELKLKANGS